MENQSITRQLNAIGVLIFLSMAFQVGTWVFDRLEMKRATEAIAAVPITNSKQNEVTSQVENTNTTKVVQSEPKKTEVEEQITIVTPQDGDIFCLGQDAPIEIRWTGPSDIASQKVSVGTDMIFRGGGVYVAELSGNRNATTSTSTYLFNWHGSSLSSKSQITGNTLQVGVSGYMKDGTQFNKIMEGSFERQQCD